MTTLLLDTVAWDLVLDVNGNIALAADPYASAQDMATELRTFAGECYYDTTRGVDYDAILGKVINLNFAKAQWVAAALRVPNITGAQAYVSSVAGRSLSGQVQGTLASGQTVVASAGFPATPSQFILGTSILGGPDVI